MFLKQLQPITITNRNFKFYLYVINISMEFSLTYYVFFWKIWDLGLNLKYILTGLNNIYPHNIPMK